MKEGLGRTERYTVMLLPILSVISAGILLYLMFPNYADLSGWFQEGLSSIPYLIWAALGGVLGFIISRIRRSKEEAYRTYSKRIKAGFFGWLLLSIILSSLTEDGDIFDRLSQGPLFKAWTVLLFISVSSSPTYMGILAVMTRKRNYIAGSVLMNFILVSSCMIFSQADSATVISQDPILSVLFIWSMISFVEGVNWIKRYVDRDPVDFPSSPSGKDMLGILWKRQVSYTVIFLGISSIIAVMPFVIPSTLDTSSMWLYSFYESSAVIGKVVVSLLILLPLAGISFTRRYIDRLKGTGKDGDTDKEGYL